MWADSIKNKWNLSVKQVNGDCPLWEKKKNEEKKKKKKNFRGCEMPRGTNIYIMTTSEGEGRKIVWRHNDLKLLTYDTKH
jgi:hypothetical protein